MTDLYTIGYEKKSQAALLQTLLYYDVQTLLDIRELPLSRKPGFSKTPLRIAVEGCGMQYVHIRALGTPRDLRLKRKVNHDEAAFRAGYSEYLATQDDAMQDLVTRVKQERCCLFCYEAGARECHRWIVAERAAGMTSGAIVPVHLAVHIDPEMR